MIRAGLAAALIGAGLGCAAAAAGTAAAAAGAGTPKVSQARLQGRFAMNGRVTSASNVSGEHRGEKVRRTWVFTPGCSTGACPTVTLERIRPHGTDHETLHRTGPGDYAGSSKFYAPLKCGSKVYTRGWAVPFRITVKVRSAEVAAGVIVAKSITATYTNRSRTNRTPCVLGPAHDSAKYSGRLQ